MHTRNNKTSICSIVFLDIIAYSKKTDSEQIEVKDKFNELINHALKSIAETDYIILDTGDGAAICCDGSPEDILYISLTIRDEVIRTNEHAATPLYLQFGINLGPVRVVKDINGRPNIIGDGINVAQRIMSFSEPNQILVSRSYYEVASRLTQEISQMFDYLGTKQDKHVREHEVYSVRSPIRQLSEEVYVDGLEQISANPPQASNEIVNWKYAMLGLIAFFVMLKMVSDPAQQNTTMEDGLVTSQDIEKNADQNPQIKSTKPLSQHDYVLENQQTNTVSKTEKKDASEKKSKWTMLKESFHKGKENKCTQAEISMNQCAQ